jgi:hypothetical protein
MASSKRTLDIDSLTYQNLFLKSQSNQQISSYTIPVIPGGSNVYKVFQYLTTEQTLSSGGLIFTPSTIPDISNAILNVSVNQGLLTVGISSISTVVGNDMSTIKYTTNLFFSSAQGYTYGPTYTALVNSFNQLQGQNIQTLNLQRTVISLGNTLSTLSTQFLTYFCTFGNTLENTFNQGNAVSSLSSYFTDYYSDISTNIVQYSTNLGKEITEVTSNDISTLSGYVSYVNTLAANISGTGVSSLSTTITSTLTQYNNTINIYNPSAGISSISSYLNNDISSLSSYFILNNGIPGICSLSTSITKAYICSILNAQNIAGTPGLCTMSTFVQQIYNNVSTGVAIASGGTISTFSTALQNEILLINFAICTVGYSYTIIQQESVKVSLSTLSTTFGQNYNNITSMSSISSMIQSAYNTINTEFSIKQPYSTINTLSTLQGSNFSTINDYMSSIYPSIYTGPGLSSFSTYINPNFSSLSTSLDVVFSSFSNSIYNISSLRTDPGVSSLSTFVNTNSSNYNSSFIVLDQYTNQAIADSESQVITYTTFSNNYTAQIPLLSVENSIQQLNSNITQFSNYVNLNLGSILLNTSNLSSSVSTLTVNSISSFNSLEGPFSSTANILLSTYTTLSSIVEQNVFSPTFSKFTTDSITTSNLTVNSGLYISSIGIQTSTTKDYTFAMLGSAQILQAGPPNISRVMVGQGGGNTVYINSNVSPYIFSPGGLNPNLTAEDIAYNGYIWVAVGSSSVGTPIKYSSDPSKGWSNVTIIGYGPTYLFTVNTVKWNGTYWLAGTGSSSPNLLKSQDGINWSNALPSVIINVLNELAWNGFSWIAAGSNSTYFAPNLSYTDANGIWNYGLNTFDLQANAVTTNGRTWVAVGEGSTTIKYSFDSSNWQNASLPQLSTATAVAWNGTQFLAGGSNQNSSNILTSYNGIDWSYISVPLNKVNSIIWDGAFWNVAGINNNQGILITSPDATTWSTMLTNTPSFIANAQAYASNTIPAIQLSNFDIYSGNLPVMMNSRKRMNIIQSTIYFNDGNLTIRNIPQLTTNIGYIGINTTYPEYALDIAIGNARKPVGTTWVTASDARVKTNITTVDLQSCAKLVLDIPLRQYSFTEEFQKKTGVSSDIHYGFIAQEVKKLLPKSVVYTKEHGLDNFHSLDTDQIFKLEFGATQYLLQKVQDFENQISTLESSK